MKSISITFYYSYKYGMVEVRYIYINSMLLSQDSENMMVHSDCENIVCVCTVRYSLQSSEGSYPGGAEAQDGAAGDFN